MCVVCATRSDLCLRSRKNVIQSGMSGMGMLFCTILVLGYFCVSYELYGCMSV